MTITVYYSNGDVEVYSSCTNFVESASSYSFTGKLSGEDAAKTWKIERNSNLKKISIEGS